MRRPALTALAALGLSVAIAACNGGGGGGGDSTVGGFQSEQFLAADYASAMAFAPDGRLFYTERNSGNVRVVSSDGTLLEEPFASVSVANGFEWGLLGITLDPDFESNGYVYIYYTEPASEEGPTVRPVLTRFTDENNRGTEPLTLIDDLPETDPMHPFYHTGSNIGFGPDGFLYITIGDYDFRENAQDLSVVPGKILRVNKQDGSAAADNPFLDHPDADPRIFAYGFRKAYDFAFHPETGALFAPDNNAATCDELNIVVAGANYGWPLTDEFRFQDCAAGQITVPVHFFSAPETQPLDNLSTVFPTGVAFLTGDRYPTIAGALLVCESTTKLLRALVLEAPDFETVTSDDAIAENCLVATAVSPDGVIYYSNETEIRRVVPPEAEEEGEAD
jgi:glucose/arabinose dehydrogenase